MSSDWVEFHLRQVLAYEADVRDPDRARPYGFGSPEQRTEAVAHWVVGACDHCNLLARELERRP